MAIQVFEPQVIRIGRKEPGSRFQTPPACKRLRFVAVCSQGMLRTPGYSGRYGFLWSHSQDGATNDDGTASIETAYVAGGIPACRSGMDPGVLDVSNGVDFNLTLNDATYFEVDMVGGILPIAEVWVEPWIQISSGPPGGVEIALVVEALGDNETVLNWNP